jgi:hypothetical protein
MRVTINNYEMDLCEDCSAAIGRLHIKSIKNNKNYIYTNDEDKEIDNNK